MINHSSKLNKSLAGKDELLESGDRAALTIQIVKTDNLRGKSLFSRPMWRGATSIIP